MRALAAVAVLSMLGLVSCKKDTDEQKIYKILDAGVAALEAGEVKTAMEYVAEDFADESGVDKQGIRGILAGQVLRGQRITIMRRDEKVTVDGATATATVDVALFQGDRTKMKGVLPERSGTYRFTITFRKDGDEWLITKAKQQPISAGSFIVNSIGD